MSALPRIALSLKGRALRALSQREYTRIELVRKLQKFEELEGQLELVLTELHAKGFLCDERAVASHINRRASKMGAGRIKQELQAKGADLELVRSAVAKLESSELDRAKQVWTKKFGKTQSEELSESCEDGDWVDNSGVSAEIKSMRMKTQMNARSKQLRFLLARGFSMQIAQNVIKGERESSF